MPDRPFWVGSRAGLTTIECSRTEQTVFKNAEERAAEKAQREAEEAQQQARRAEQAQADSERRERAALLATPVGAATEAKRTGEPFLEVQLEVGTHIGNASWGMSDGKRSTTSSARTLGQIESVGWRLEHASYFFMITGETSSSRVLMTGESTAVSGVTVGVYLFRNTDAPAPVDQA